MFEWKDYPDTSTPLNAENLNKIREQLIVNVKQINATSKVGNVVRRNIYKIGRLVVVNITFNVTATTAYSDVILTDFIKPLNTNVFYAGTKEFVLNTNGELYINNGYGAALGYVTIAGTYISAE